MITLYSSGCWGDTRPKPGLSIIEWPNGAKILVADSLLGHEIEMPQPTRFVTGMGRNARMARIAVCSDYYRQTLESLSHTILPRDRQPVIEVRKDYYTPRGYKTYKTEPIQNYAALEMWGTWGSGYWQSGEYEFRTGNEPQIDKPYNNAMILELAPLTCPRCEKIKTNQNGNTYCADCADEIARKCKVCGKVFLSEINNKYCSDECRNAKVIRCHHCETKFMYHNRFMISHDDKHFCSKGCYKNHMEEKHGWERCHGCENIFQPNQIQRCSWRRCPSRDEGRRFCARCLEQRHQHDGIHGSRKVELEFYKRQQLEPTFGWELEFGALDKKLHEMIPDSWGIHPDGSVTSGLEALTPPHHLTHMMWTSELKSTINKIQRNAKVDRSCGSHMHVGNFKDKNHAIRFYISAVRSEELWMGLANRDRHNNGYTRWVKELNLRGRPYDRQQIVVEEFERYRTVNWTAYEEHGTVEIRAHHGTIDFAEMVAWEMLWSKIWKSALKPYKERIYNCCEFHFFDHLGLDAELYMNKITSLHGRRAKKCDKPRRMTLRTTGGVNMQRWWNGHTLPAPVVAPTLTPMPRTASEAASGANDD